MGFAGCGTLHQPVEEELLKEEQNGLAIHGSQGTRGLGIGQI